MKLTLQTTRKINLPILILGVCSFMAQTAFSQNTWKTSAVTTSWADAANWSTNAVPTANDDVIIIEGANVRVPAAAVCRKLQINGAVNKQGKVTIEAGATLTVTATDNTTVTGGVGNAAVVLFGGMIENNGIMTVVGRQSLDAIRFDEATSGSVNSTYTGAGTLVCNTFNTNGGGGSSLTGACITFAQTGGTATFMLSNTGVYTFSTGGTLPQGTPVFPTSKSVFYCANGNAVINGTGSIAIGGDRRAVRVVPVLSGAANLTIESGVIMQLTSTMGNGNSGIVTVEIAQADATSKLTNKGTLNFSGAKGNPIGLLNGVNATSVSNFVNEGTININGDFTDATLNVTSGGVFLGGVNIIHGTSFTNASTGIINYNTLNIGTSVKPLFFTTNSGSPKYTITNNGTITIGTNGAVTNAIKLGDSKTVFNNAGTMTVGRGNIVSTLGTGLGNGTNAVFNNNTGGVLNFTTLPVASAANDSITFNNVGGTLRGSGTFSNVGGNTFTAASTFSPGQGTGAGIFTFNDASLTLNGTFNANINGKTTAGTDFDRINAPNATVNITGLTIVATTGYAAATNDEIVLINAANITGTPTFTLPRGWVGSVSGGQVKITATRAVSVRENTEGGIRISPNPISDKLRIKLSDNGHFEPTTVKIYDLTGRQVLFQKTTADVLELDMTNLAKGIYLVRIDANNSIYTEKIARQ
jgi:Secretion system C-terminal sorting domain